MTGNLLVDLLTGASSVCTGRWPSPWTCTCRADPRSIWALHTSIHLKHTGTKKKIALVQYAWSYLHAHTLTFDKDKIMLAELFTALCYVLWGRPAHHKLRLTHWRPKNMLTHLQTSSRGCLWPQWPVEHGLHRGTKKKKKCEREMKRQQSDLPSAWLQPGWRLNKAAAGRQKRSGCSPPCLLESLSHPSLAQGENQQ